MWTRDPVTFDEEARPWWSGAEEEVLGVLRYAAGPVPFSGLAALFSRRDMVASAARDALWRLVGAGRVRLTPRWQLEAADGPLDEADEMRRRLLLVAARLGCREKTGRSWEEAILYMPNIEPSVKERHWCLEEAIKRLETEDDEGGARVRSDAERSAGQGGIGRSFTRSPSDEASCEGNNRNTNTEGCDTRPPVGGSEWAS